MLLDLFVYPVSGVLKLWHLLLHDVLHLADSAAWALSIFGLVIVVRGLIAPFSLIQGRSARVSALMRPAMAELEAEYRERTDKAAVAEFEEKKKQLREDYGYKISAGCVPPLIQLPVFIGLYRFLLLMARPEEGLETDQHAAIGLLSAEEVSAFLDARIFGVPLPAYVAMDGEQFAQLGTSRPEVLGVVVPLLVTTILFTSLNFALSLYRNALTLDWNSKLARGLSRFLLVMFIAVPVLLAWLALYGPLPAAIVLYWVANNLWTLVQAAIIHFKVERELPLTEEHHEQRRAGKNEHKRRVRAEKDIKAWEKRKKRQARREPARRDEIREEVEARRRERAEAEAAEKEEEKRLKKQKSRARAQLQRERMAERRAQKAAKKKPGVTGAAGRDAGDDDGSGTVDQPPQDAAGGTAARDDVGAEAPEPDARTSEPGGEAPESDDTGGRTGKSQME